MHDFAQIKLDYSPRGHKNIEWAAVFMSRWQEAFVTELKERSVPAAYRQAGACPYTNKNYRRLNMHSPPNAPSVVLSRNYF
jgi:hypothetical protein